MKKILLILVAMLSTAAFVFAEDDYELTTRKGSDGKVVEIYVKKEEKSVTRIEYNYKEKASNSKTKKVQDKVVANSPDDSNTLRISYYLPIDEEMDTGDAETIIQETLYDFLHDYKKNKMKYTNYRATGRKNYVSRVMTDFVNNLPETQEKEGTEYQVWEITYYIYN